MLRIKDKANTNTKEFWDNYYSSVGVELDRMIIYEQLEQALKSIEFETLLEIGCGTGIGGKYLKSKFNCHYTGTDFSTVAVKRASVVLDDTYELDIRTQDPKTVYDVIVIAETLEHLDNPYEIVDRCLKYCKYLVLSLPLDESEDCDPEHVWCKITPEDFNKYDIVNVNLNEYYFQIVLK